MRKIIASRFPGKCKVCQGAVAAGERVYWLGKGHGVQHLTCADSKPDAPTDMGTKGDSQFTIKFTDLRDAFRKISSGDYSGISDQYGNKDIAHFLHQEVWNGMSDWTGCTIPEMYDWLERGFIVDGLAGVDSSLFPAKPRRKLRYSEDGDELLIDLAWSGVDEHFIEWEKRMTKPGLKVEIYCTFQAGFPPKIIVDYQRWIARMLQSLDEAAIDCEVNITNKVKGNFVGDWNSTDFTSIRVKESGEVSDIAAWSAMFSPGGFRQLMFTAKLLSGDHLGKKVCRSLGSPQYAKSWTVAYDEDSNTLTIANAGTSSEFPEFEMTEKFKAVLESISR